MEDLIVCLDMWARHSQTCKLWADNLIKLVIIMMTFARAAHESDMPLHLAAAESMFPHFFSAVCHNYSTLWYFLCSSHESLPTSMMERLRNDCSFRHIPGINNGVWTDMFMESRPTYRYEVGTLIGGATGLTINPRQMIEWVLSVAIFGELSADVHKLSTMRPSKVQEYRKEEAEARIQSDPEDRAYKLWD